MRMIIADTDAKNENAIDFFKTLGFSPRSHHLWLAKTLHRPAKKDANQKQTQEATKQL